MTVPMVPAVPPPHFLQIVQINSNLVRTGEERGLVCSEGLFFYHLKRVKLSVIVQFEEFFSPLFGLALGTVVPPDEVGRRFLGRAFPGGLVGYVLLRNLPVEAGCINLNGKFSPSKMIMRI